MKSKYLTGSSTLTFHMAVEQINYKKNKLNNIKEHQVNNKKVEKKNQNRNKKKTFKTNKQFTEILRDAYKNGIWRKMS